MQIKELNRFIQFLQDRNISYRIYENSDTVEVVVDFDDLVDDAKEIFNKHYTVYDNFIEYFRDSYLPSLAVDIGTEFDFSTRDWIEHDDYWHFIFSK